MWIRETPSPLREGVLKNRCPRSVPEISGGRRSSQETIEYDSSARPSMSVVILKIHRLTICRGPRKIVRRSMTKKMRSPSDSLLPRSVRYATAAVAAAIVLALASLPFLSPHRAPGTPLQAQLPPSFSNLGSTPVFIPIYVVIVIGLVFGGMYLFKWIMDYDPDEPGNYDAGSRSSAP